MIMSTTTKTHRSTRDELIEGLLKAELVGPQISPAIPSDSLYRKSLPEIKPLDINGLVNFSGHEAGSSHVCK